MQDITIRNASLADAPRILEIYAWYVEHTVITFEYDVPSLEEFEGRMRRTMQKYPYLVIERDGRVEGYAYAGPFVGRAAYDWACELTIYLDNDARKHGMGRALYTFEYDVPSLEEFEGRMRRTMQKYPYLVIERDGRVEGYAYAGPFVGRAAYDWACELTIYLDHDARKHGMGRALYEALADRLQAMGILNLYACIGYPQAEDEYLTRNSARFHEHLGFALVGTFHNCGYKFGRWYDMVWMEKIIGEHRPDQPPVQPYIY